ncbi:MAG: DUF4235 domain-containing protein [Actinomycetota bacterium]|nr:DUF4235 domain-containing protein [Actinomycetota bacterium]
MSVLPTSKGDAYDSLQSLAGIGAAIIARKILTSIWNGMRADDAPEDPTDLRTPLVDALIWAAAAGLGSGVARLLAARTVAKAWTRTTGDLPHELARS